MSDPNSFDAEIKDAQANPEAPNQGTGGDTTPPNTIPEGEQNIDYQKKFAESSKEALRLFEENKKLNEELAAKATATAEMPSETMSAMYPGFEDLDTEAQKNLINYTNIITERAKSEIYKDPAISHARAVYNESKFDSAFGEILNEFPQLKDSKDEFKKKYYNPNNTPDNIKSILGDLAKVHLFDKAKEIGAEDERTKQNRIDMERSTGGDKTPRASRTLGDWQRMASENPAEFARHSKEYHADLESGKLRE